MVPGRNTCSATEPRWQLLCITPTIKFIIAKSYFNICEIKKSIPEGYKTLNNLRKSKSVEVQATLNLSSKRPVTKKTYPAFPPYFSKTKIQRPTTSLYLSANLK
ncbi:MAG: hypothetical protein C4584_02610 [Armatimonadetes bacterium]|nr:MAG: hypothetical protein C4584_02610 [Armatimonadota bacterium]